MAQKVFLKPINDTTSTGGTGTQTMIGKSTGTPGYVGTVAQNGDSLVLCYTDQAGNFEVSNCTVSIASDATVTVSRDTVIVSSNSNAKVNFTAGQAIKVSNYVPATLEITLFNLQYQIANAAQISSLASDISDMKDAITLLLDGGNP